MPSEVTLQDVYEAKVALDSELTEAVRKAVSLFEARTEGLTPNDISVDLVDVSHPNSRPRFVIARVWSTVEIETVLKEQRIGITGRWNSAGG